MRLLADELTRLGLAIAGPWRKPVESPARFSHHRKSGYGSLVAGVLALLVVEALPVQLALGVRHPRLAWTLTALSAYAALWLLGDWQALRLRRTEVDADRLRLAVGLRWRGTIPLAGIARAVALPKGAPREPGAAAALLRDQEPTVRLELARPCALAGPRGAVTADRLLLAPDEAPRFLARLAAAGVEGAGGR